MPKNKKRLILIDGNALIHRAYHALPPLTTKKGEIVNAVYGFLLVLFKAIKDLNPEFIICTFDVKAPTFRHEKFKEYKAKRQRAPDELYNQIPKTKELLKVFKIPFFEKPGFEADDLIATIATKAVKKQVFPEVEVIIVTGDSDTMQLINDNIKVFSLKKGLKDTVLYGEKEVAEKYDGLKPEQLPDFKGLVGDASDNIPGIAGVGDKTASDLLKKFNSLESLYQEIGDKTEKSNEIKDSLRKKIIDYKEQVIFCKKLNSLDKNVDIDFDLKDCVWGKYNETEVIETLKGFEFFSLVPRFLELNPGVKTLLGENGSNPRTILEEIESLREQNAFSEEIYTLEKMLIPVVKTMEENGIKIDLEKFKKLSNELEKKVKIFEEEIYDLAKGPFNINSPQQLSEVLFERLEISTKGLKKTPGGVISTSVTELEKLKKDNKIVKLILDYRNIFKLKSGFVDPLPDLVKKDGRIHPSFHQLGTTTGRFSCSDPNLQNIPIKGEMAKEIRQAFVVDTGYKLVSFDYSQMELRIVASIAKDEKMIGFFKQGKDIHKMTASQIFNTKEEDVTEKMRDIAKTLNFGIVYGISAYGFAESVQISYEEADNFILEYLNDFQGVAKYREDAINKVKELGYVETILGRKRFLPEINSLDRNLRNSAERMAINHPCQGTAADIIKEAMVQIDEKIISKNKNIKMLIQIHDELLFEVKENETNKLIPQIKEIMENCFKLEVPLKVDVGIGENWGQMQKIII